MTKKYIKEDAPINAAGGGEIAGIGVGSKGEPGLNKAPLIRRKKFAGHEVFEVSQEFFHKCRMGKKKYDRYDKYVGEDDIGQAIRAYGRDRKTSNHPIIVQDELTGHMCYLKYGKGR